MNGQSINQTQAHTLYTYAIDHPTVKREMIREVVNQLAHRVRAKAYDEGRALKAWGHVAEYAARLYKGEHGAPADHWRDLFSDDARRACCVLLSEHYADEIDEIASRPRRVRA